MGSTGRSWGGISVNLKGAEGGLKATKVITGGGGEKENSLTKHSLIASDWWTKKHDATIAQIKLQKKGDFWIFVETEHRAQDLVLDRVAASLLCIWRLQHLKMCDWAIQCKWSGQSSLALMGRPALWSYHLIVTWRGATFFPTSSLNQSFWAINCRRNEDQIGGKIKLLEVKVSSICRLAGDFSPQTASTFKSFRNIPKWN